MRNRNKYITVGFLTIVILIVIGASYALWKITLQQESTNVITTGCFKFEFQDENPIGLEIAYPITDNEGMSLTPYEFTIKNTCESYASYQINLEILNNTTLNNLDYMKIMLDEKTNLLTENNETTKTLENATKSFQLKTGYLRENQSKTFSLRLWMDESTPTREEFMNKAFLSKVTIIATFKENLDNNIETIGVSQNESFSDTETFQIHVTSESYDIVSMSEDLETWEELENKGKDIIVEKTVTTNGTYTYYFQDEAENIQDISVTATKIDDQKPIANMNVTKTNNIIAINASTSRDNETSVVKYYYSKDGINFNESISNTYEFIEVYEYGVATTMLTNYEENQIKKVYLKVEDEVGNVSDVKEIEISSEFAYDGTEDNNLRYIGTSPDNYVSFNNELWRIIGVMNNIDDGTGKKEKRMKLIRNESIGEYSWDSSSSGANQGSGVNEWSTAGSQKLLNDMYYNSKSNQKCYSGVSQSTKDCDFSQNGLLIDSQKYIDSVLWNTGANDGKVYHSTNVIASKIYELERSSNIGKICPSSAICNDPITRTTTWLGKIGLMYPSDYGYATSGGSSSTRTNCLNQVINSWGTLSECTENNWLYKPNENQWTMTPHASSESAKSAFNIESDGSLAHHNAFRPYPIYPVIYLKSNVKIISGDGSKENSFKISIN